MGKKSTPARRQGEQGGLKMEKPIDQMSNAELDARASALRREGEQHAKHAKDLIRT
jgi:hypothetical protein